MNSNRSTLIKNIGKNIRDNRTLRNMSIEELAAMVNLSPAFMGLVERGRRGTKLDILIHLCEIFSISLEELVFSNNSKYKDELNESEVLKMTLSALTHEMTEKELKFLVSIVHCMKSSFR